MARGGNRVKKEGSQLPPIRDDDSVPEAPRPLTIRSAASLRLRPQAKPVQLLASPESTFLG